MLVHFPRTFPMYQAINVASLEMGSFRSGALLINIKHLHTVHDTSAAKHVAVHFKAQDFMLPVISHQSAIHFHMEFAHKR